MHALCSHRPSVRLSVTQWYCRWIRLSLAKITRSSPSDSSVVLVFGKVRFIRKFGQNRPERGHQITVGYWKVQLRFKLKMSMLEKPTITNAYSCSALFPATAGLYLHWLWFSTEIAADTGHSGSCRKIHLPPVEVSRPEIVSIPCWSARATGSYLSSRRLMLSPGHCLLWPYTTTDQFVTNWRCVGG